MSVLVAYASTHGATREIAQQIADELTAAGIATTVCPITDAGDPAAYEAAIIGSAVYFGAWRREAMRYIRQHRAALALLPVWLFSSGPLGSHGSGDDARPKEFDVLAEMLRPRDHRVFAGALDRDDLSLAERVVVRVVHAPEGDFRDWEAVRAWADDIVRTLAVTPSLIAERY